MSNAISIMDVLQDTTVDGPGFRTAIYASGCTHACPGCHNPQSWNVNDGKMVTVEDLLRKVKESEFANVTFSGGDPLMQPAAFTELARRIKEETAKNIWCYTGYVFERIVSVPRLSQILPYVDVVVDGPYMKEHHNESVLFAGSSNQRLIDVKKSLRSGKVILWTRE